VLTTVNTFIVLPVARCRERAEGGREATNAIAHMLFGRVAGARSSRSFALTQHLGVLFLICKPISL
jgi:hypothetical protein